MTLIIQALQLIKDQDLAEDISAWVDRAAGNFNLNEIHLQVLVGIHDFYIICIYLYQL
jgi:hypothetical protein